MQMRTPVRGALFHVISIDSGIAWAIPVPGLMRRPQVVSGQTHRGLIIFTSAMAAMCWLMGYPQAKFLDWLHRRYKVVE
jgi:hypothetical protein